MMCNFDIIESDSASWNEIVKKAAIYDFYHTSYYHKIDNDHQSLLLLFSRGDSFIALPLVVRNISDTDLFDITSVYGYAGPVARIEEQDRDELLSFFKNRFVQYCRDKSIVSVFSRLHPLIDQQFILNGLGEILNLNKTVSIDLTTDMEEQRAGYRKSLKSELNQLRRKDIVIQETKETGDINRFTDIYYETMNRVHASSNYYFSRDYFQEFLSTDAFHSKLLVAKSDGDMIAGAIFTYTDKIMQYHLAGTTEEYIKQTPMKLILDEARLSANALGLDHLHLGGGVGGRDDDSLFRFKSGFSKNFKQFSVWQYIVDKTAYDELVASKTRIDPRSNFFPLYRY